MKKAQSLLEYALLVGVVAAALMAMGVYVQRAIKANLRIIEEQVNTVP
jgi:Flp pilus assembly pilin Flp